MCAEWTLGGGIDQHSTIDVGHHYCITIKYRECFFLVFPILRLYFSESYLYVHCVPNLGYRHICKLNVLFTLAEATGSPLLPFRHIFQPAWAKHNCLPIVPFRTQPWWLPRMWNTTVLNKLAGVFSLKDEQTAAFKAVVDKERCVCRTSDRIWLNRTFPCSDKTSFQWRPEDFWSMLVGNTPCKTKMNREACLHLHLGTLAYA